MSVTDFMIQTELWYKFIEYETDKIYMWFQFLSLP